MDLSTLVAELAALKMVSQPSPAGYYGKPLGEIG